MIQLILVGLAGLFKALADTLADHFDVSIFRNKNRRFWDKTVSWKYAKKLAGYKFDGWHLANSAMIFCFVGAVCFPALFGFKPLDFGVLGVVFILSFNGFYNHILKK